MAIKYQYFDTAPLTATTNAYGAFWRAQTFTPVTAHLITSVKLFLYRVGSPGVLTISIRATSGGKPTGSDIGGVTGTTNGNSLTISTAGEWREIFLSSGISLDASTKYAIVVRSAGANSSNTVVWKVNATGGYTGGDKVDSSDSGDSWATPGSEDCGFEEWGTEGKPETDKTYSKKLVAIGSNRLYYESSIGTIDTELTDARNDIITNEPLTCVEAFQKIFIANKTKIKVADFANTKITTTDILPSGKTLPLKGDIITATAGATSGASMVVDYIDATDGTCNIYGYRTTVALFVDTDVVTGTNDNGDISFTLNADETAPPHWYSWTVYSGDATTYGTMPTQPTITCLYRGRLFLSGDSTRPHQWWLTKVDNPWSVVYDSLDPLSGVSGGDADVGEIGDIVTAGIPYKDDLLIIGCVNSIWVLIGDPTAGGQLAEVSLSTGIWGSQAWCIDDKGSLYFLGNDGLYRVPLGVGMPLPENISRLNLPNLIADLDLDKSLHRVVLSYDPFNYGIIITRTLLSDGTNTGYWFDLTTQGFYPESYPVSCGVFSAFYYQATDDTYKKFLLGCNDGYIREFDNSTLNDATTSSTTPINSYCTILQKIAPDSESEGKLTSLTAIIAGGVIDAGDASKVTYSLYRGDNAEVVLENIKEGVTAFATGSWITVGKQNKVRQRMRGTWMGIKLSDSTASKTWSLEKLFGNVEPAGKI